MTVSSDQRLGLARAVSSLRRLFEDDLAALAEGKFGIHVDGRRAGELEEESALSLSAHDAGARAELVGVVEYLVGEGLSASDAVQRMLREAVFTTVNRILAIRVAEAIGVLPESLAKGTTSEGFVEVLEVFPLLRDADHTGGYWSYLQLCGDELSHAVPRLFDRRHPLSSLVPSAKAVDRAIEVLSDSSLDGVWEESETLGWSYQFFNTSEERRGMRDASAAPRDSRELAVRNQFFTPGYVVDFLVQNTLGRRLRESGSEMELPMLLGEVDMDAQPLNLDDVSVLDPAVGSGHFLLGAYDLLEEAWVERGLTEEDAAPKILRSLFGIEIDPRAAQVAQAVLYLRARRSSRDATLDSPTIVTARPLPRDPDVRAEVISGQPAVVRDLVEELSSTLETAPNLGSLLRVEEVVSAALGERMQAPQLGDDVAGSFESIESAVLHAVGEIARRSAATPAERLFAADAFDAVRFVELCIRRYDTVLMNPPFGKPVDGTRELLRGAYPRGWPDLYAAFVDRGRMLLRTGGLVGALTNRSGFYLTGLEDWRRHFLDRRELWVFADLGWPVLQDATVEVAAYVVGADRRRLAVLNLLESTSKDDDLLPAVARAREDGGLVDSGVFLDIPGSPLAYWASDSLLAAFSLPKLEPEVARFRAGLQTNDDFRFLRLWWEVSAESRRRGWVPLAKGGDYRLFYDPPHLVVDWTDDGRVVREFQTQLGHSESRYVRSIDDYFKPGLTWVHRTNSAFSPRFMPGGGIFGIKGPAAFVHDDENVRVVLGYLASRPVRALLDFQMTAASAVSSGSPARSYDVGKVRNLPWPELDLSAATAVDRMTKATMLLADTDEAMRGFFSPFHGDTHRGLQSVVTRDLVLEEDAIVSAIQASLELDQHIVDRLAGSEGDANLALDVERAQGTHPGAYADRDIDLAQFRTLYESEMDTLVDSVSALRGGSRWVLVNSHVIDRRIELLCHALQASPASVVRARRELGEPAATRLSTISEDLVSYLFGVACGRWDVRSVATAALCPDPLAPLPVCPPGMLMGEDGLPATLAPEGYPLVLPPDRILHDDPGHEWDVVAALDSSAMSLFDDPDSELRAVLKHLKTNDLRTYLRGKFFPQHVKRYSKSRRKAPIYWYLSVPSREWGVWMYSPWLSREQLFAVARAVQDKARRVSEQVAQLRRDLESREDRVMRGRLEAAEALRRELEVFHEQADAVAQSGWEPDLNDGIILNAAPLEDLFADPKWRKDIAEHRKNLQAGEYPWATVQKQYFHRTTS